jgi:hypothetical protein
MNVAGLESSSALQAVAEQAHDKLHKVARALAS